MVVDAWPDYAGSAPYGIDAGFRDPSGNRFRLTQLSEEFASA